MEDYSNAVKTLSIFLVILSALATFARLCTKWVTARTFRHDDISILIALVLNVGSGTAAALAASSGVGQAFDSLSIAQKNNSQRALYASELLTLPTNCAAKISIIYLLRQIFVHKSAQQATTGLGSFLAVWCLASTFTLAFQNQLPSAWDRGQTDGIDMAAFFYFTSIVNIITDVFLISLPLLWVSQLRITMQKKSIVVACFAARIIDIIVSAVQLKYTGTWQSPDLTGEIWTWVICNQVSQTTNMVTSSIPYLRQLMEAFPDSKLLTAPYIEFSSTGLSINTATYILRDTHGRSVSFVPSGARDPATDMKQTKHTGREAYNMFPPATRSTAESCQGQHHVAQPVIVQDGGVEQPEHIFVHQSIEVDAHIMATES